MFRFLVELFSVLECTIKSETTGSPFSPSKITAISPAFGILYLLEY
jgi:hypothetical protein